LVFFREQRVEHKAQDKIGLPKLTTGHKNDEMTNVSRQPAACFTAHEHRSASAATNKIRVLFAVLVVDNSVNNSVNNSVDRQGPRQDRRHQARLCCKMNMGGFGFQVDCDDGWRMTDDGRWTTGSPCCDG
jgi:hypothetical protein